MINFVSKSWGYEKWLVNNDKYCGKILHFVKGRFCSVHYHMNKEEHFYLQKGKIKIKYFDSSKEAEKIIQQEGKENFWQYYAQEKILHVGDIFHVPSGRIHQMIALEDSELVEISTHHVDADSYRILPSI